jgi:hypothetical protein
MYMPRAAHLDREAIQQAENDIKKLNGWKQGWKQKNNINRAVNVL